VSNDACAGLGQLLTQPVLITATRSLTVAVRSSRRRNWRPSNI